MDIESKKHERWKKLSIVLTGTLLAQGIPLISSLAIARIFLPAEFGIFSIWLGVVSIVSLGITGRYEMSLGLISGGNERSVAVRSIFTLIFILGGLGFVVTLVMWALVCLGLISNIDQGLLLAAIPTAALLAISQVWQQWASVEEHYGELSTLRIISALATAGFQIGAGLLFPSAISLSLGIGFGVIVALFYAERHIPLRANTNLLECIAFWRQQSRFPGFALPGILVNSLSSQLPVIIVGHRFGVEIAGIFAMTMRVLGAPMALLGSSVLDVFRASSSKAYRLRNECRKEYLGSMKLLLGIAVIATLVVMGFGNNLFPLLLGEKWRQVGMIAEWLMPMFALRLVASPLSYVLYISNKQPIDLIWQGGLLAMTLSAMLIPSTYQMAIGLYSLGYAGMYLIYLYLSNKYSKGVR